MPNDQDREHVDEIFMLMNDLFTAKAWDEAGQEVAKVNVAQESLTGLIAWLTACMWTVKNGDNFPGRDEFRKKCAYEVMRREPHRWQPLLRGLV